ncbi:MAG TPA: ankyrin repeat domain-containing protein [Pirellulales bacterium]|jgi:ankyrin repeat protein|nr:ankyrin repeat domain-containing protein [Pirellulales bacterium]
MNINLQKQDALCDAIRNGDFRQVTLLLAQGAAVNEPDHNGFLPLSVAFDRRHIELARFMLDRGATLHSANQLLKSACGSDWREGILLALEHHADVNSVAPNGTPVYFAIARQCGHENIRLLLNKGLNSLLADEEGTTILHLLAEHARDDLIPLFLSNGADVNAKRYEDEETPLHYATRAIGSNCVVPTRHTVAILLTNGAWIESRAKWGQTPLHYAASSGNGACAAELIQAGARIDSTDDRRCTPLYIAARFGRVEIIQMLLEAGADPNAYKTFPLISSIHHGITIATMLLENGTEIDRQSAEGKTAIMCAASLGYADVVRLLVNRGANLALRSNEGYTALDYARNNGFDSIAATLL